MVGSLSCSPLAVKNMFAGGCGSFGRVVAFNTRGGWFESSHGDF